MFEHNDRVLEYLCHQSWPRPCRDCTPDADFMDVADAVFKKDGSINDIRNGHHVSPVHSQDK